MNDATNPPSPRATAEQINRDEARIQSEIAGTDEAGDPFTAAVRATRMPMVITDPRQPDNPIAFVNDSFCRLTGYSREEILGRNCRFLQGPETDPETVRRLREAIAAPRSIEIDIRNHKKDGTPFWNRLLMAPVNDANGQLAYFFASQLDVTLERERLAALEGENAALTVERRANQVRLEVSEESLRLATEAAEVGTWDLDLTTDVLTWSDRTKAMFGISPDVPCSMADFYAGLHPEDLDATSAAFASALDPERRATYDVEYRTIGKEDGVVRWVAAKGRGLFDESGRCVRALGTAIDITARRDTQERLRFLIELSDVLLAADTPLKVKVAAAEALGHQLRVGRAGYGEIADNGEIVTVERDWTNEAMPSLAGRARVLDAFGPEAIAVLRAGQTLVVEDCRTDPRTADPAFLATWESINTRALIVVPLVRDGTLRAILYAHSAEPREWAPIEVALAEDVAVRTWSAYTQAQAEAALRELNETLEQRVEERSAELRRAEEALRQSQKLEAVGQLTGGVAHDFNNLLTIIRSSVDFLRRPELPEDRRKRYMDAVADTVDRATKLTGQLLAFARRQALKPEVFEVGARLKSVADMLDTVTGSRISVVTELPEQPCFVLADVSQFETALINMAVNARDAMSGEGQLTLRLSCVSGMPPIRGHGGSAAPFAAISLEDTGVGIEADQIGRIFEPFFTTKEVGKGTGLGLSQVFGFAKQSGGDVNVESTPGQGTTFTLYLPEVEATPQQIQQGTGYEVSSAGAGRRVLVVEDNVEVGRFATQILQDLGYEPAWAANAEEALDKLGSAGDGFDVVFSDVVMPGMGGLALAKLLRERLPHLPVVLASGYSDVLAQEGSSGFELLHKPYAADQLGRMLNRVIQHHLRGGRA
ncbi:PAS domain-containing protein [Methylobacterium oxalidis]|uniref:PAS domain-containing protein n=1 Tax=Methylobacterium oxalidis TaxID=944322 RepID=UPI0033145B02